MTAEELQEAKAQLARMQSNPAPAPQPRQSLALKRKTKQTRRGWQLIRPSGENRALIDDYTHTMSNATLESIRDSIMQNHPDLHPNSPAATRLEIINQTLKSRGNSAPR